MKTIYEIYEECAGITATPGNTCGMGNPMPPTDTTPGSEPITAKSKNKKEKLKKKKETI